MIPVIFIHKGFQKYLELTIKQANKNNFVYLIGDTNPNLEIEKFEFCNIKEYLKDSDDFTKIYEHLSTNPVEYELFCYKRWFVLRNFMKEKKLDIVFYIDSDVMLFSNTTEEWSKFDQYDMTLLHRTAAVSSFITIRAINNFCNMLLDIYTNKTNYAYKKIKSHFTIRQECKLSGGVCDMTLLEYFHYHSEYGGGPGRVGEMMQIINDSTYDHNINTQDQDFAFNNGIKKVELINKKPYVYNIKLKKDIKFNTLHFQGNAKNLIFNIYNAINAI